MLTEDDTERAPRPVADEIETTASPAPGRHGHHDQFGRYTHELGDGAADASSRALARFVPLAYGLLFGGLVETPLTGLAVGAALSVAADLFMGSNSLLRTLARGVFPYLCPTIAAGARRLAAVVQRLGLAAPAAWCQLRCRSPHI